MYFAIGTPKVYRTGQDDVIAVRTSPKGTVVIVLTQSEVQLWAAGGHRMRIGVEKLAKRDGTPLGVVWREDGLACCVYSDTGVLTAFEIGLGVSSTDHTTLSTAPTVSYPAVVGVDLPESKELFVNVAAARFVGRSTLKIAEYGSILAACADEECLFVSTDTGEFLTILWKFVGPASMLTTLSSSMGYAYGKGEGGHDGSRWRSDPAPLCLLSVGKVSALVAELTPPSLPTPPTPSLAPLSDFTPETGLGESMTGIPPIPTSFTSLSLLRPGQFIATVTDTPSLCLFEIVSFAYDGNVAPEGLSSSAKLPCLRFSAVSARECAAHILKEMSPHTALPLGIEKTCSMVVKGCSHGLKGLNGRRHVATLNRKRGLLAVSYGGRVVLHDVNQPVHKSATLTMEYWGWKTSDIGHVVEMVWTADQEALAVIYAKRGVALFHWSGVSLMTTLQRNSNMEASMGPPGSGSGPSTPLSRYSATKFSCIAFDADAYHIMLGFGSKVLQVELAKSLVASTPAATRGPHVSLNTWKGILLFRHPDLDVLKDNWDSLCPPECYTTAYGPMRFTAFSEDGQHCVVVGVRGCALYNARLKRWRLWAVQEQEAELEVVAPPCWISSVAVCLPARDTTARHASHQTSFASRPQNASSPVNVDPYSHSLRSTGFPGPSTGVSVSPKKSGLLAKGGFVGVSPNASAALSASSSSLPLPAAAQAAGGNAQPQQRAPPPAAFGPTQFLPRDYYRSFHGQASTDLPDRESYARSGRTMSSHVEPMPPPPLCGDAAPEARRSGQTPPSVPLGGGGGGGGGTSRIAYCLHFYPRFHLDRGSLLLKIPLDNKPILVDSAACRQTGSDGCYSLVVLDESGKVLCFRLVVCVDSVAKPSKVTLRMESKRVVNIETTGYIVMLRVLPSPPMDKQVQGVNDRAPPSGVSLPAVVLLTHSGDLEVVSFALRTRSVIARSVTCMWLDPVLIEYGFVHVVVSSPRKNSLVGFLHPHHKREGATCVALQYKGSSNGVPGPPHIVTLLQDADTDALPVGMLAKEGLLISATEGVRASPAGLLPEYHVHVRTIPYLHTVLLSLFIGLASTEDAEEAESCAAAATALARTLHEHSFFVDVMDYLVHSVLYLHDIVETRSHSVERSAVLREVLRFLSHYPDFFAILVHSLRKADPGMWSLIFAQCPPLNIFRSAVSSGRIQESAMLLRVLQMPLHDDPATELHVAAAAANKLFPLAVSAHKFELSAELLRFLTLLSGEIQCTIPSEDDVTEEALTMLRRGQLREVDVMMELLGIDCTTFLRTHGTRPEGTSWTAPVFAELHRQFGLPFAAYSSPTSMPQQKTSPSALVVAARVSGYSRVLSQWRRGGLQVKEASEVAQHAALLGFITPAQVHLMLVPPSLQALVKVLNCVKAADCKHLELLLSVVLLDLVAVRRLLEEDESLTDVLTVACTSGSHEGYKVFLQSARRANL